MGSEAILGYWGKALLSLPFIHLFCVIVYRRFFSPLSKFPGPFWGSITDLYSFYYNSLGKQHLAQYELHKKYGPVVRYKPNLLIVSEPTMLPVIYHRYADKTDYYVPTIGTKTTFVSLEHQDHANSRRRIIGPYNIALLGQVETKINTWVGMWTDKLRGEVSGALEKQLTQKIHRSWLAYDMLADVIFGKPFGFVAAESDLKGIIESFESIEFLTRAIIMVPSLVWLFKGTWLGSYLLPEPPKDRGIGFVMEEAKRLAQLDEVNTPPNWTYVRMVLEAKGMDGTSLTPDEMASEARITLVGAAVPFAAYTVEFLLNILGNPACYDKVIAEITKAESDGQLSGPVVSFAEAKCLPYFTACLKETLRGAEATISMVPRMAAKGGTQISGQFVPEGTHLSSISWITQRNRAMYGEDAEIFRPERWLEASPEKLQQWNKYEFGFGYGARACPGKTIGLMTINKLCLQILREFKISKLNKDDPRANCFTRHIDDKNGRDLGLFIEGLRDS